MIPKVIHFCWFGKQSKPQLIKDCIDSWRTFLPEYEIKEWNETNSDLTAPFVRKAYHLKKWAFVSDFIRLKVLYQYGGIYLDTDMMVVKSFESLLGNKCFFGAEDDNYISAGIIGVTKNNFFIEKCLTRYESCEIVNSTNWNEITIPIFITALFRETFSFDKTFDKKVQFENIAIYPAPYFYPLPNYKKYDKKNFNNYIVDSTFAIHLWNASWVENDLEYKSKKNTSYKTLALSINKIFKKLMDLNVI